MKNMNLSDGLLIAAILLVVLSLILGNTETKPKTFRIYTEWHDAANGAGIEVTTPAEIRTFGWGTGDEPRMEETPDGDVMVYASPIRPTREDAE